MVEPTRKPRAARPAPRRQGSGCLAGIINLLTVLLVLLSCLSGTVLAVLFSYPRLLAFVPGGSAFMPDSVPAVSTVALLPTLAPISTDSAGQPVYPTLPPVWTPTDTPTITNTPPPASETPIPSGTVPFQTKTPTPTITPTPTKTPLPPTATSTGPTPKPTATRSQFTYTLQPGSPTYLSNFLNNQGCNWFGIVGRVFASDGSPVINLTVHLDGPDLSVDALTGSGPSVLGPGGYQIPLSDHPQTTTDLYHVELRSNTGTPQSDNYSIPTFGDCLKNAVMVNFVQNH